MHKTLIHRLMLVFVVLLSACGGGGEPSAIEVAARKLSAAASDAANIATNLLQSPGFEANNDSWVVETASTDPVFYTNAAVVQEGTNTAVAHEGTKYVWLGGYSNALDVLYQDVTIGRNTNQATLQFWYDITTGEDTTTTAYDTLKVELISIQTGASLGTLRTYSNLDKTTGWTQSVSFDLSAFKGQSLRLKFTALTDNSVPTSFYIDEVSVKTTVAATIVEGINPITLPGKRSDYSININADNKIIVKNIINGTTQILITGKRLIFSDSALGFDIDGNAGQAYRVYQAAFNRTPDNGGLGYWINAMDNGISLKSVSEGFVNSAEYKALYGSNPTNSEIIKKFYDNVLHRPAEIGGFNFWVGILDRKADTVAGVLAAMSESAENKAQVLPNILNGINFSAPNSKPIIKKFAIETIKGGSSSDPLAIIRSTNGSTISYFGTKTGANPTQAQFKSAAGVAQTVYFDDAGLITKIVDNNNGDFMIFHPRSDGAGVEYIMYDVGGRFINGFALFSKNGKLSTAKILGLPGDARNVNYGASVYGPITELNNNLSKFLTPSTSLAAFNNNYLINFLGYLIPSAHAFNIFELQELRSGAGLMFLGTVAGGPSNPLGFALMVGGAVQIYRGLSGQAQRALDVLSAVTDNLLTGRQINPIYEGEDFLQYGVVMIEDIEAGNAQPVPANAESLISRYDIQASEVSDKPQFVADTSIPAAQITSTTATSSMPLPVLQNIVINKVEPAAAFINVPINIVVTGTNLGGWTGLVVQLDGCKGMTERGGTDTSKTFTCTPGLTGLKAGSVSNGSTFARLNTFYVTVTDAAAPEVSTVLPLTATQGQLATFSVTGKNLLNGMVFSLTSCNGTLEAAGGSSNSRQFYCTPAASGTLTGIIQDKPNGITLKNFTVVVASVPIAPTAPVIATVSPTTATLNQLTTFTVTGSNLIDGMRFTLDGCSGNEVLGVGTSTMRQFTCSSALSGVNNGEIKDKIDGSVLKMISISVNSAKNITCKSVVNQYSETYKYCFYLENRTEIFDGIYEIYNYKNVILSKENYKDGALEGLSTYYAIDFNNDYKSTIREEGIYNKNMRTGLWRRYYTDYFWGVESLGKLYTETTYVMFSGISQKSEEKYFCPFTPSNYFTISPANKYGVLYLIYTYTLQEVAAMANSVYTSQRLLKNGCSAD